MEFSALLATSFLLAPAFYLIARSSSGKSGSSKSKSKKNGKNPKNDLIANALNGKKDSLDSSADGNGSSPKKVNGIKKRLGKLVASKIQVLSYYRPIAGENFVGRDDEIHRIVSCKQGGAVIYSDLPFDGVGKTSLAMKAAEVLSHNFPDGHIYLDLNGNSSQAMTPEEIMGHVIRAFMPRTKIPTNAQALATKYQTLLSKKRSVIIFDDVKDAKQIANVLPPKNCFYLVTGRTNIALQGALKVKLMPLTPEESKQLLVSMSPEIGALAIEVSKLCGFIPICLVLAGGVLATSRDMTPMNFTNKIRTRFKNLDNPEGPTPKNIEALVKFNYGRLTGKTASTLHKLSIFKAPFDAKMVEFVCEDPKVSNLQTLVKAGLVQLNPKTKRYSMHKIIQRWAKANINPAEKAVAQKRFTACFLTAMLDTNDYLEKGEKVDVTKAIDTFYMDWENIQNGFASTESNMSKDKEAAGLCYSYVEAAPQLLEWRQTTKERTRWLKLAIQIAHNSKDDEGELEQHINMGKTLLRGGDLANALSTFRQALEKSRSMKGNTDQGDILDYMGYCLMEQDQQHDAMESYETALTIHKQAKDPNKERRTLIQISKVYDHFGELPKSLIVSERVRQISQELKEKQDECKDIINIGKINLKMDEYHRAMGYFEEALKLAKETKNHLEEGNCLWNISKTLHLLTDNSQAIQKGKQAIRIMTKTKNPEVKKAKKEIKEWSQVAAPNMPTMD
jgi:tetratricopeptide (TPR) repeat protein